MARQQQHHHGQGGVVDPIAARQKEEQRRRQQAYAQALAQQVQQRELQKQRDRDIERQGSSHGRPGHQGFHDPGTDAAGKGLFDGFGEKDNSNRKNFARGQRQLPPQHHEPQQVSPKRFNNAPQGYSEPRDQLEFHYNNNNNGFKPQQQHQHFGGGGFNPDFVHQGHGNPQLFAQPQQFPSQQQHAGLSDWGAPLQPPQFGFRQSEHNGHLPQQQQQQYQQEERIAEHFDQHQHHQQQFNQHQPQYHEPQQHGRGLRADPPSGGFGAPGVPGGGGGDDDSKARYKLQQQMEIQSALQKQVEEKNRLKLEAKRRQDEEDRREVERFEAEQRRLKQEEERIKDEKRKKAEEELVRAQQAAAALADHQKKAQHHLQSQQQQQQVDHQQQHQASPPRAFHKQQASPMHHQQQQHHHQQQNRKSPQKLDPFANTRAHLFEDPPVVSPQRRMMQKVVNRFNSHAEDEALLATEPQRNGFRPQVHRHEESEQEIPMRRSIHRQPGSFPDFQHRNASVVADHTQWPSQSPPLQPQFVDPTVLLRQYDEMKQELMHQRQIVDELREAHAQIQLQQQQQQQIGSPSPNGLTPTLSDLEQLRNELREELLQREKLHRQELEKFHKQQEQLRNANLQSRSSSREALERSTSRFVPGDSSSNQPSASSDLKNNSEARGKQLGLGAPSWNLNHSSSGNNVRQQFQGNASQERELGSTFSQAVLNTSHHHQQQQLMMPTASLQCDSKMVYFDGQVRQEEPRQQQTEDQRPEAQAPSLPPPTSKKLATGSPELVISLEDSMDELVLQLDLARSVVNPRQRASVLKSSRSLAHERGINNQDESVANRREPYTQELSKDDGYDTDDDDDDALAFFIKDFREPKAPVALPNQRLTLEKRLVDDARASASGRYSSWMADDEDEDEDFGSAAAWKASSRMRSRAQRPHHTLEIDEEPADNEDDESELSGSASLSGEELEAIFQRNVRRHEILLSFQPQRTNPQSISSSSEERSQGFTPAARSMAWTHLHQQLEENVTATSLATGKVPHSRPHKQGMKNKKLEPEDSLIASSRWMPSVI